MLSTFDIITIIQFVSYLNVAQRTCTTLFEKGNRIMANMLEVNSKKIKEAREKIGKSQAQIAIELDIPKNTYLKYEHGDRIPPLHVARKIANKLKIEIADIYSNSEDLLFQTVNEPIENISFVTPYKYNYWHNSNTVELVYPDSTKLEISINEFMKIEKQIQDFIDMTFINALGNNQK